MTTIPDPLIPNKPAAEDIEAMHNRHLYLEMLYDRDGRDNPDHPRCHSYTGLYLKCKNAPCPASADDSSGNVGNDGA